MRVLSGVCLGLSILTLAACDEIDLSGSSDRYREDFHFNYPLNAGASVQVENTNGSVEIVGWDKNTVDIDGTKYANTEERMREIKIEVTPSANSISIRTVMPVPRMGNYGARYVIHVPKRAELQNIISSNGAIRVETIEGHARLKTSNGAIRAFGMQGSLDARTSNGSIDLSDVTGDTSVHTSNGTIKADVKKGNFEATTSNGNITARLIEPDSRPVRLESSNGHIDLTMDAAREVHADTSNSSITVRMPSQANATVRAHTSNSSITSDFDVSLRGGLISKHRLEGNIGSGGPLLDLGTSNGAIRILRL
jgi:DUF4097 and DUF4098 domain-containing protein YvlB